MLYLHGIYGVPLEIGPKQKNVLRLTTPAEYFTENAHHDTTTMERDAFAAHDIAMVFPADHTGKNDTNFTERVCVTYVEVT